MTHPLDKFLFCPVCGSRNFVINNFKSKRCDSCGFIYYANPCAATAAFVRNELDEILVAVRANDPAKGTLDLPGGFVDMYESAEQGIMREIKEETGLSVESPCYLFSISNRYLYSGMTIHTLDLFYEVIVDSSVQVSANDDAASLQWMPLDNINPSDFGLHSISRAVNKYLSL